MTDDDERGAKAWSKAKSKSPSKSKGKNKKKQSDDDDDDSSLNSGESSVKMADLINGKWNKS